MIQFCKCHSNAPLLMQFGHKELLARSLNQIKLSIKKKKIQISIDILLKIYKYLKLSKYIKIQSFINKDKNKNKIMFSCNTRLAGFFFLVEVRVFTMLVLKILIFSTLKIYFIYFTIHLISNILFFL